jgi:hypothetical protein
LDQSDSNYDWTGECLGKGAEKKCGIQWSLANEEKKLLKKFLSYFLDLNFCIKN